MNLGIPRPLRSLYGRFALLLFVVVAVLMAGFGLALISVLRTHIDEVEQKLNQGLATHLLEEEPALVSAGIDEQALHRVLHTLMVVNPRIELYVLDARGRILAHQAEFGVVEVEQVALAPIQRFLERQEGEARSFPIRGTDPKNPGKQATFSVAPITGGEGNPAGFLYVVLQGRKYQEAVGGVWASYAVRVATGALVLALIAAVGTGMILLGRVAGRVKRLAGQSQKFAASGFREAPTMRRRSTDVPMDEIDRLEETFGEMSAEMVRQLQELEQLDTHRRELVANVSHDLRTPVAILRGYIETLQLKSEVLSTDEREELLDVALKQSERLGRLVDDLFELAMLDAGLVNCERDLVSVAELVQDVAQKFELPARECQVRLTTELDPRAPRAWIDVGLIERVIENLLDNALRHTPPGGDVTVAVRTIADSVEVSVSDTGSGIAEEDLSRIFERFYRGKANAADRRKNVGLGLAIARKALELHQSQVTVWSDGKSGAAFRFALRGGVASVV